MWFTRRRISEPHQVYSLGRRKGRRRVVGTRAPILVAAHANARWSLDFVHDQMANGRRFRVLNVVDDVTRECLANTPVREHRDAPGYPRHEQYDSDRYSRQSGCNKK